jgi:hypothetical protein
MTTASLTISTIAILIVFAIVWNTLGGKEDADALGKWWRRRGPQ